MPVFYKIVMEKRVGSLKACISPFVKDQRRLYSTKGQVENAYCFDMFLDAVKALISYSLDHHPEEEFGIYSVFVSSKRPYQYGNELNDLTLDGTVICDATLREEWAHLKGKVLIISKNLPRKFAARVSSRLNKIGIVNTRHRRILVIEGRSIC